MPINKNQYILNLVDSGLALTNEFTVDTHAVRLIAAGLAMGDVITLQQYAGPPGAGYWQDVARNGVAVVLTTLNSQHIEIVGGRYRVTYVGASTTAVVWMEEEFEDLGTKIVYSFNQPVVSSAGSSIVSGSLASMRLNIDPQNEVGPEGGLLVVSTNTTPPTQQYELPWTSAPQGLGIADPYINDPTGVYSFTDNASQVTINQSGYFRVSVQLNCLSSEDDNYFLAQVFDNSIGLPILDATPLLTASAPIESDIAGLSENFWVTLGADDGTVTCFLPAGTVLRTLFFLHRISCEITLSSCFSIDLIALA